MFEVFGSAKSVDIYTQSGLLSYYFLIMCLFLAYLFYKVQIDKWFWLILLIFTPNLFMYLGVFKLYKIVLVGYVIIMFCLTKAYKLVKNYPLLNFCFFSWSIWFFISCFINDVPFFMTFSQYGVKYLFFYFSFFIVNTIKYRSKLYERIVFLLKYFLVLQSVLAIVKFFLWRFLGEGLVGTLTINGGGPNNIIPIVGFLLIWSYKCGKLNKKDWLFCLFLLISPIFGAKRSIWFFFPILVGGVFLFDKTTVNKKIALQFVFLLFILLPLIFYLGVRLNPTLNPEHKFGGSFDIDYVLNYAETYTLGDEDTSSGRLGIFFVTTQKISNIPIWGVGQDVFKVGYDEFAKNKNFAFISSKGEVGALTEYIYSFGIFGAFLLVIFQVVLCSYIKNFRLRWIVVVFLLVEMIIFYNNLVMSQAMFFVFLFACLIRNKSYYEYLQ